MAREQWFENTKPVPWAKLPRYLWALINDESAVIFPPYVVLSLLYLVTRPSLT
jgi:hypothetical protein